MDSSNQLWGHGDNITASQRRRMATNSSGNIAPESDYSEDENLFDSIERELDEREEEAKREQQQQWCLQEKNNDRNDNNHNSQANNAAWSQSGHDDEVDFLPMRDDLTTTDGSRIGMNYSPAENKGKDEASNNDSSRNQIEATDGNAAIIHRTISKRRREYSVIKSTTPRFSFQSSGKSTSTTIRKSPVERHSISSPLLSLKSNTQLPKKSVKRKHRHSFRQSIDRNASKSSTAAVTEVNNNMREFGFAPKFLANTRARGFANEDTIGDGDDDARTKRMWNRLTSSQAAATSPYKQSTNSRRNKTGGYLIQNLRSLRNNEQRMVMRLRASAGGYSSMPMASKRRRSSSGGTHLLDPKQGAASELDVTVMGAAALHQNVNDSHVGAGKIRLAYIHRYTGTMNYILPCYSWIVLPQNVVNEQSIGVTQLRCYDAIIIPPNVASISEGVNRFL